MRKIIELKNIRKNYKIKDGSLFDASKTIKSLNKINFTINVGECIGVIGNNGSGKTTLLKLLAGIIEPTAGRISVLGDSLALLDVGGGIQEELTGKEIIYFYGALIGIKKELLDNNIQEIFDFSGISNFSDIKMKYYSAGMKLRLIFAISMSVDHELYLIDEILAVGDNEFQQKCIEKLRELRNYQKTIIIASHDFKMIRELCDKVIVMHLGELIAFYDPGKAIAKYVSKSVETTILENKQALLRINAKYPPPGGKSRHNQGDDTSISEYISMQKEKTLIATNLFLEALYCDLKKKVKLKEIRSNYHKFLNSLKNTIIELNSISGDHRLSRKIRDLLQAEILINGPSDANNLHFKEILSLFDKEIVGNISDLAKLTADFGDFLQWINIDMVEKGLILDALTRYKKLIDKGVGDVSFNQWNFHMACINFIISADYEHSCEEHKAAENISQKRITELLSFRENVNSIRLTAAGWTK